MKNRINKQLQNIELSRNPRFLQTNVITSAFTINGLSDLKKLTKTDYGRF